MIESTQPAQIEQEGPEYESLEQEFVSIWITVRAVSYVYRFY